MDLFERRMLQYLHTTCEPPHPPPSRCTTDILIISQSNLLPYKAKFSENARTEYDKDLAALVLADKPDLVVCAGFMNILNDTFLDPLADAHVPIINLHPALPVGCNQSSLSSSLRIKHDQGQFNGAKAIERAQKAWLEGKVEKTGIMIHQYVVSELMPPI